MHDLARAFGDLIIVKEYSQAAQKISQTSANADTQECLNLLFRLDALTRINTNIGTWLEVSYIKGDHALIVRRQIKETLTALKRHMIALTYAYSPSEDIMDSMLAPKDGDLYNSVINRIYSAPKAFERIDNWKDLYQQH